MTRNDAHSQAETTDERARDQAATDRDWRDAIDDVDAAILDGHQAGFPVRPRPFRPVAEDLGIDERAVVDRIRRLIDEGLVRRFAPVLNPPAIGSSALVALSVPEDRFDAVAATVNSFDAVNHNYRRDHPLNLWFVVTAPTLDRRQAILDRIDAETGLETLRLPMRTEYYVDLAFPVVNEDRWARESESGAGTLRPTPDPTPVDDAPADLTPTEARVVLEVQDGLPVTTTPYADVARAIDVRRSAVLDAIKSLADRRCIKRIGAVVNHRAVGFDENCMVVWQVPGDRLDECGRAAGRRPYVTYCCHRPSRPDRDWPYTTFTMVHGRDRAAVDRRIDELASGPVPFEHERLETVASLKQTGVQYTDLVDVVRGTD